MWKLAIIIFYASPLPLTYVWLIFQGHIFLLCEMDIAKRQGIMRQGKKNWETSTQGQVTVSNAPGHHARLWQFFITWVNDDCTWNSWCHMVKDNQTIKWPQWLKFWYISWIPAPWRKRRVGESLSLSLVYIVSSRTTRAMLRDPGSKKKKKYS